MNSLVTKKIRTMRGVVVDAIKETPDTWTLKIFAHEEDRNYLAGQFISLSPHQFAELKDLVTHFEFQKSKKELVRAYSLTSAPHEKYLAITIKPESFTPGPDAYPPLLSPFLASDLLRGREIEFTGFSGAYILSEEHRANIDHAIHLIAGSGVVPSFSIIKDELIYQKSSIKHSIILVNRTQQDIIFHNELKALSSEYSDRLKIHYFLTQDSAQTLGTNYHAGRPHFDFVKDLVTNKAKTMFFACGPAITKWQKRQALESGQEPKPRFMEWVHEVLERLEIEKKHIKREVYG
jgi:3-ketosteroid 9alpha-monooxygenase subunit B